MIHKRLLLLSALLISFFSTRAQLVINEISQGGTGTKEYVELVVVGTRTCSDSTADLRNWIIDDNPAWYGAGSGQGIAGGCMRFANVANWAAVPYGSIILLYNSSDKNLNILLPDDPTDANNDHVYVVPDISTYLEKSTTQPPAGNTNASFSFSSAAGTFSSGGSWATVGLANAADAFVVVSPSVLTSGYHSVAYGGPSVLNNGAAANVYFATTGGSGDVYYLTTNQYNTLADWTKGVVGPDETPGAGNTVANTAWINSMRVQVTTPVVSSSSSTNPTTCNGTNGSITLNGLTANTSYTVTYQRNGTPVTVTITSNASGTVIITGLNAGSYTNVVVSNGSCSSAPVGPFNLTSPTAPATPTASSNSPVCAGATLNLTTPTVTGATYSWTGPNGFASATQNPSITNVTAVAAGTYSVTITVGGCTSAAGTTTVTVNPVPAAPTAGSNSPVCAGSPLNLTASTVTGATYSWTGPNTFTSNTQNPTIAAPVAASAGVYSVTATVAGCTSAAGTTTVVVNPRPTVSTSSSANPTTCGGTNGSITLNGLAASTSYTVTYSRNGSPVTVTITSNASGTIVITGLNAGNYTNVVVSASGCSSAAAGPFALTDPAAPAAPVTGSNSPVCIGNTLNLTASTVAGATYSWNGPNSFTSASQNPSIAGVTAAAAGTYSVTVTVSGCTSAPGTVAVVVNPNPVITNASGTSPTTCAGSNGNITLSGLTANTTYTITYTKNGNPITVTLTSNASGVVTIPNLTAGTYASFTAGTGGCTSAPFAGPVALSDPGAPAPSTPGSNSPICSGNTLSLTATTVSGAVYNWSGPNGFSTNTQNPSIPNATTAASGSYNLSVTVNGCTSVPSVLNVVVNQTPATPVVTSNSPVCVGNTLTLNAVSSTGATYSWTGPNAFTSSAQSPTIPNATIAASGTYTVTVSIATCSAPAVTTNVVVAPTPAAPTVTSPVTYCQGATAAPLIANGTNVLFYTAATGGSGVPNLVPSTAIPGSFTYYATQSSNGCESSRTPIVVNINPKPTTPVVTPVLTLCQFQVAAPLTATGTNLVWYSTPTGGVGSTTAPTPSTQIPGTYHFYVSQTATGCESDRTRITVIVNAKPAPPTVISPLGLCQYDTVSLTASGAPNGSFTWYYTATGGVGVPNIIPNTAYEDSAYYYVTQTVNGCESDRARLRVFVSYKPNGIVLPTRIWVCEGELDSFSYFGNATPPQAVFNWTTSRPNNQIVSGQGTTGPLIVRFDSAGLHYVRVQVNNRGCLSEIASQPVSVRPNPRLTFQVKDEACQDEVINVALSAVSPLIDSFKYAFPGARIVYGANSGGPYGISYSTPGIKVISTMATTRECPSRIYYDTITVHPLPDARFVVGSRTGNCAGDSVLLRIVNGDSATHYVWTPDHFFSTGNIFEAWGVVKSSGYVKVNATSGYGCKASDSVLINAGSCCELYFPNAFSPNNDTKNDVFRPVTHGHHEIKTFRIINRWGQVVYESKDDRGYWDGTFNGKEQEVGTYYYYIRYNCLEGGAQDVEQKGEVILMR